MFSWEIVTENPNLNHPEMRCKNWHCDLTLLVHVLCSLPTCFRYSSKPSLLPPRLCSSTSVLIVLSSTKAAGRSCRACLPAFLFLWAGDCWWVAPFIPSVRADTKNTSHTHIRLMLCYWSSRRVQNRFNRTGFFFSITRLFCVVQDFGQVLCIILDPF